ncbi:MAG: TrlF family AAA-like ATPase [Solirubrobacterales bacterium]
MTQIEASKGAFFIRADLHVHTYPDSDPRPDPDFSAYIEAARANEIGVLAVTDHNTTAFVAPMMAAAENTGVQVIPGIEISTRDGHLLALFDPDQLSELEALATTENLNLKSLSDTERRSERSMIDLVDEIGRRGGLGIPAHVDASKGIGGQLSAGELADLLSNPGLAGLEFATREALLTWFTAEDEDLGRKEAWKARQRNHELAERGLARLMSSDAHSPEVVGRDRASRTLTRLRLDDPNFAAIRNAVQLNPKARCKAEVTLPASYPRLLRASFEGGFLDGVTLEFSPNLNCLVGGRGSGKSTALLAVCAALGASPPEGEDPDDPERMPTKTTVAFIDKAGSERVAVRERGKQPVALDGTPVRLRLADLGQDESGRLARGYRAEPEKLLAFLDGFIVKHEFEEREEELLSQLADNGSDVTRTAGTEERIQALEGQQKQQEGSLKAAQEGRIEEIARYAVLLSAQKPLLARIRTLFATLTTDRSLGQQIDLDALALEFGVDLEQGPVKEFVEGDSGLRARLATFHSERTKIVDRARTEEAAAAQSVLDQIAAWQARQEELETRLAAKRAELKERGLEIQADAVLAISKRLDSLRSQLTELRDKRKEHQEAVKRRGELLSELEQLRARLYETRKLKVGQVASAANERAEDLRIHVIFDREGINGVWRSWLSKSFSFREPRVSRIAELISPGRFAELLLNDPAKLAEISEDDGSRPFELETLKSIRKWDIIFALQTMRLEDRPRVEVQRPQSPKPQPFDHLSAGQQRSVLLSLLLCAEQSDPLILDQPEDHLDGQYIASAVVRHLEAAKERRQVVIATHSPNLVVLGDSELVIPMRVEDDHGHPYGVGAVDRPDTRDQVCALLEGGADAYRRRGERYGFTFKSMPPSATTV